MIISGKLFDKLRSSASKDFSLFSLRTAIILWSLGVIALALVVKNKWLLASILAYEVLP